MINIKNFHSNLLKIDKKWYKDIDIYYIGYITNKKFGDCENIHSIIFFYLIIHSATGYFKEKNGEKYLIIDSIEEVLSGIRREIKHLIVEKNCFIKKNDARIGINTDDDLPLNKALKVPPLAIIIRCVFQEGEKLYRKIYLDECLYELVV